jgi:agmatine deiminase
MYKNLLAVFFTALCIFRLNAQQADPNNGLRHVMTPEEASRSAMIGLNFTETDPPAGAIRNVEEFGNNDGALIRYPFGIPMSLIKELAKDAKLVTMVSSTAQQNTVTSQYQQNGVNLANCSFLIAPTDSYWARDYGPWYVTYGDHQVGIVDFPYNRPRPNDDEVPKKVAAMQGISWFGMNVIHTGGNYMTNGLDQASSTTLVWTENPTQTHDQIALKVHDYLGINNYMVEPDPNGTYIDHIDCWGKFLAPDKVLIRKVPVTHPQYTAIEQTAAFYASQVSSWGTPYQVFRVFTPNNEPYTNSFILKNKVFVPIMGTANDNAALMSYQQAMPGYQINGFIGNPSTPWESTDALHCRVHEMADLGMLDIAHLPLHDSLTVAPCFAVNTTISAFSGQTIWPDSVWTIYRVNAGDWDTLRMSQGSGESWSACIPGQTEGSAIDYFIQARDASGRIANHPYIGMPDPHRFYVKISPTPRLTVAPDTLIFHSVAELTTGKAAIARNYTQQDINVTDVTTSGTNPFPWQVDPWTVSLPYVVHPGDSLVMNVKPQLPGSGMPDQLCDTLLITAGSNLSPVMICLDADLFFIGMAEKSRAEVAVFPNPVTDAATFRINLPASTNVQIAVYSAPGELLSVACDRTLPAGESRICWQANGRDGHRLPPGIYLYRVNIGDGCLNGKLILSMP